jgi:hypothetical protein
MMRTLGILFSLSLLLFFSFRFKQETKGMAEMEFGEALNNNLIQTEVVSTGGFQDSNLILKITPLAGCPENIHLPAGHRFIATDSSHQDLIFAGDLKIKTKGGKPLVSKIRGYCCEATDKAPRAELKYEGGFKEEGHLLQLCEFIAAGKFDPSAIQSAIWSISNDHQIAGVIGKDAGSTDSLRRFLAKLKNIEIPWYYLSYLPGGEIPFSGKAEFITGSLSYYLKNNAVVSINVRNAQGKIMKGLVQSVGQGPGEQNFQLKVRVEGWPKGRYYVGIYIDGGILLAKHSFDI